MLVFKSCETDFQKVLESSKLKIMSKKFLANL